MGHSIGEFSKLVGVSIHALRYYEKENLIVPARRENGRRLYSEADISWLHFIKRLKNTGMPIKEIQVYAQLRATGDSTLNDRMEMLVIHRDNLQKEMIRLEEHLVALDNKIDFYRNALKKGRV